MRTASYLIVWWMSQVPHAAVFENQIAAEAAASVRNALMIRVSGEDIEVDAVLDWYRRNSAGEPMPAEWRDVMGKFPGLLPPKESTDTEPAVQVPPVTTGTIVDSRITKARGV